MKAVVIVASTSGYLGQREDKSGPALKARLENMGFTVPEILLLPDDRRKLSEAMRELADEQKVELIVTTGGTGFARMTVRRRQRWTLWSEEPTGFRKRCALTAVSLRIARYFLERQRGFEGRPSLSTFQAV